MLSPTEFNQIATALLMASKKSLLGDKTVSVEAALKLLAAHTSPSPSVYSPSKDKIEWDFPKQP